MSCLLNLFSFRLGFSPIKFLFPQRLWDTGENIFQNKFQGIILPKPLDSVFQPCLLMWPPCPYLDWGFWTDRPSIRASLSHPLQTESCCDVTVEIYEVGQCGLGDDCTQDRLKSFPETRHTVFHLPHPIPSPWRGKSLLQQPDRKSYVQDQFSGATLD